MPRQSILVLGLAALALVLGPGARPSAAADPPATVAAERAHLGAAAVADEGHRPVDHAEEKQPNILEPQPSLAIWTVVVFLGLLFVLGKFAWKPLLEALHQREEHLEHVLLDTERARNESEQLLERHRKQLEEAADQVRAMIEEARRDARASADEIVRKAQDEAEASRHRAERDIASARDQALGEIWSKTADLAVSVAGKVLAKNLDEDDRRRLVETALSELPASANGHGGRTA
jgi:F-type H+-transporting ATPase subunit b